MSQREHNSVAVIMGEDKTLPDSTIRIIPRMGESEQDLENPIEPVIRHEEMEFIVNPLLVHVPASTIVTVGHPRHLQLKVSLFSLSHFN